LTRLAFCACRRAGDSEEGDREPRLSGSPSLKDADRAVLERAADSLHCAGVNSKPFGNDAHTGPLRSRQSLADSFFECGGAFTFTLARARPARTRSAIIARSNSAKTPIIWNMALPACARKHRRRPCRSRLEPWPTMDMADPFP
jgi:hypothetical protein